MRVSAGISASGINQSQGEVVTAPLPVWGLFADYNFTPRFSAFYNYQFFFVNYQDKSEAGSRISSSGRSTGSLNMSPWVWRTTGSA